MDLTAEELAFLAKLTEDYNEEIMDSIDIYKSFGRDFAAEVLGEQLLSYTSLASRLREESKKVRLSEGFPYAD
ncbi:hypothetical protein LMOIWNZ_00059 [Enterococcus phage vB_OCPT_CCS3]|nr:hypothetical protein LMOIWNZ_00059 [Enterococcus phage vB_OCPT_CCS3]